MVFLHVHSSQDKDSIKKINHHIRQGKPAFILIYMEGCGPCNATRPEWSKLENVLTSYKNDNQVAIADIDQTLLGEVTSIKEQPAGFPTMLYIQGNQTENYEKGRTVDEFVEWIKEKTGGQKGGNKRTNKTRTMNKRTKNKRTKKIGTKNKRTKKIGTRKIIKTRKVGGLNTPISPEIQYNIPNIEIIFFLIKFLEKTNLKNIILSNHQFINNLENEKLTFGENKEFRHFINDAAQWFLLDFNKEFFNSILEIIKNTFEKPNFLNKNIDSSERYRILLKNVYDTMEKNNNKNDDVFTLLGIILRVLKMPNMKETILQNVDQQLDTILTFKKSILCLLTILIKEDLIHNPEIRKLLKEIIEDLTYNNVYSWETLKKLIMLIGKCSSTITGDVSLVAAKGIYNTGSNVGNYLYQKTSNLAKNLYGKS